nr:MAG TPA: hypothetical protein [Caudoviricetes sp.]
MMNQVVNLNDIYNFFIFSLIFASWSINHHSGTLCVERVYSIFGKSQLWSFFPVIFIVPSNARSSFQPLIKILT